MNNRLLDKRNLNLLKDLTISSFKLRNEGSFLGAIWYFLNPLIITTVLFLVFSENIGSEIDNFAVYVLVGVVSWSFFSSATFDGISSIDSYSGLIKKSNFPREIAVFSSVFKILLNHIIEIVVLLGIILFTVGFSLSWLFFPFILLTLVLLSLSISLILSSFFSYYRDITNMWRSLLLAGWFLTPIFYLKESLPQNFQFINLINPMVYIIEMYRSILIYSEFPDLPVYFLFLIFNIAFFYFSLFVFRKMIRGVAERI